MLSPHKKETVISEVLEVLADAMVVNIKQRTSYIFKKTYGMLYADFMSIKLKKKGEAGVKSRVHSFKTPLSRPQKVPVSSVNSDNSVASPREVPKLGIRFGSRLCQVTARGQLFKHHHWILQC